MAETTKNTKNEPLAPVEENHVFTGHPSEYDNRDSSNESEDESEEE